MINVEKGLDGANKVLVDYATNMRLTHTVIPVKIWIMNLVDDEAAVALRYAGSKFMHNGDLQQFSEGIEMRL